MKTFTAKVSFTDNKPRFIPNCTIYKEKLVQISKKGIGTPVEKGGIGPGGDGETWEEYPEYVDYYKPFINGALLEKNGLSKEEALKLIEEDSENGFKDDRLFNSLMVMGENEGGKFVEDYDEILEQEKDQELSEYSKKEREIPFSAGIFGLVTCRLPRDVWSVIKPFGEYHRGDENDREWAEDIGYFNPEGEELKGWFYSDEAVRVLLEKGYPVTYRGNVVNSIDDIDSINKKIEEEEKRWYDAREKYNKKKQNLINQLSSLFQKGKLISEKEGKEIPKLSRLHFRNLDYEGIDIFGGGRWLHLTDDHLYIVHNNGADGDNWSMNNYETGGAGAIAVKVKRNEEINKFLNECEKFNELSIEDFLE